MEGLSKENCSFSLIKSCQSACEEYPNNNDSEEKQDVIPFKKKEQFEEVLDNTTRKRVSVAGWQTSRTTKQVFFILEQCDSMCFR